MQPKAQKSTGVAGITEGLLMSLPGAYSLIGVFGLSNTGPVVSGVSPIRFRGKWS